MSDHYSKFSNKKNELNALAYAALRWFAGFR